MADCCLIKKVATVEVYENKNEVRAYGFMAGDRNTPVMEVRFKHLWGESNLSSCKLRWIIVDDVGSLLVGEVPITSDNTALINLPNELFTGDRRMKVQLTVASCDGERILNLQQFTDLKVINSLAPNEVVEPVYQILINAIYDESQKYLKELETSYTQKYGSLDSLYKSARASLEQYLITAENGGNAEFLQGYSPAHFQKVENTINDLIASTKYDVGDVVEVLGYYSAGDGGGHKRQKKPVEYNGVDAVIGADGSKWGIVHSGEVNVSWFGAKGDGISDDATSLNNAINFAKNTSSVVRLGESHYITSKLSLFLDNDNDFGNRINIVGNGSGNSKIFTNMNISCLEIKSKGSVNNHSYMKLEGFRIFKSGGSLIGTGIIMDNIAYAHFNDLIVENFKFGIDGSDTLSSIYTNCIFRGNDYGLNLYRIDSSRPNALNFVSCIITGNNTWGMQVLGGSLLNMSGGSVEGNAIRNTGTGAKGGILLNDMGNEGSVGAIFTGVYFEYNKGNADVHMTTSTQGKVSYCFSGCSFNRIDKDIYTTNNILLESNTPCVLSMNGNGFKSFNNYIPSADRKTVKLGNLNNNYTIEDTNYYYDLIDKPDYNVVPCGFLSTPIALLSYNGSTGIVTKEYGISAIEKQAIGTYVVTLNKEMPDEQPIVILSVKDSAIKSCSYTVLSKNSIAVYGYTDSGASSDLEFSLCVYV